MGKLFSEIISYFNPIYFYYVILYVVGLFYESIYRYSIWQIIWNKYMDYFGDNEAIHIVLVLNFYTFAVYWVLGLILFGMQKFKYPKSLASFKIQPRESEIENGEYLTQVIRVVLHNQIVTLLLSFFAYFYFNNLINIKVSRDLPRFSIVMRDLFVNFLCQESLFYYSHRVLHHRWFYNYLHKQHHEFITPVCITAQYAGVIEHLLSNVLPTVVGIKLMGAHMSTVYLYYLMYVTTTLNDHSGYHLPFLHSAELHDYHHLKFNVCFGTYGILDYLHGTFGHFKTSKVYDRHRTLWSFRPIEEYLNLK